MYKFPNQSDQNTWNTLMVEDLHWFETKVRINNVEYSQSQIMDMTTQFLYFSEEQPVVGGCLSAEIDLRMLKPQESIPRMAEIEPFVRVTNGTTYSKWMPQGVFFIDTREESKNDDDLPVIRLHGYDAMLKTEAMFPSTAQGWPKPVSQIVQIIADEIEVDVDSRTNDVISAHDYSKVIAPFDYTMRETLSNIASMYAGNWIITLEGKLLLVALNTLPIETSLLVDESGNTIMFGEDAISLADTTV